MIFFVVPDNDTPIGGNKQIYRNVELLSSNGFEAFALHVKPNFQLDWFKHTAPTASLSKNWFDGNWNSLFTTRIGKRLGRRFPKISQGTTIYLQDSQSKKPYVLTNKDILVFPEFFGPRLDDMISDVPFVIFNQNTHATFRSDFSHLGSRLKVYDSKLLLGAIVVSEHNLSQLAFAFPEIPIYRVVNGVDTSVFYPPEVPKLKQIAFMPRKLPMHAELVLQSLFHRRVFEDWKLESIQGVSEREVAETMRQSAIFLSTSDDEGFGLPPAEAGMCGCFVVGYDGYGGGEFFKDDLCMRVPQKDALALCQALEAAIAEYERDPNGFLERGIAYREFLCSHYSLEQERDSVLEVWGRITQHSA